MLLLRSPVALGLERGKRRGQIGPRLGGFDDVVDQPLIRESAVALALLLKNVFTSHPAMTVVLVGGFALGVGNPLVVCVRRGLIEIGLPFIRPSDLIDYVETRVLLGHIPGDDTNLVGARLFLRQAERAAFP